MNSEKGLTLLELLASITILSIIILTFLSFFTNAFRFNTINSDSIQAMNIAREEQALIKEDSAKITTELEKPGSPYYIREKDVSDYHIKISIKKEPEYISSYKNLHVVHVEVDKNGKLFSETYTYLEGRVRSNP